MKKFIYYITIFILVIFIMPAILTNRTKAVSSNDIKTEENTPQDETTPNTEQQEQSSQEQADTQEDMRKTWKNKIITYCHK